MRVQFPSTTSSEPRSSYTTTYLWTGTGQLDTAQRIFGSQTTTENPDELNLERKPFSGSLSKVQHSEPVIVTQQSDDLWSEETPHGITFVRVLPNQNPRGNKCGSQKS